MYQGKAPKHDIDLISLPAWHVKRNVNCEKMEVAPRFSCVNDREKKVVNTVCRVRCLPSI